MGVSTDAVVGCLLGTAVGDATGLCCEGLSQSRQHKLYPHIAGPQLFMGRGMVSDDTEHTCVVAQALIAAAGNVEVFERVLARQLRTWLLGLPAGTGKATLQACVKLWLGYGARALILSGVATLDCKTQALCQAQNLQLS